MVARTRRLALAFVPFAVAGCASRSAAAPTTVTIRAPAASAKASAKKPSKRAPGRLAPEEIQRVVREHYGVFRKCYEVGLVVVRFVIERDGSVGTVKDQGSTIGDPEVISCVLRAYEKLSFPDPDGGIVTVVYPIEFSPG